MSALDALEKQIKDSKNLVFWNDVDLALAEDITVLVERAARLRQVLSDRRTARMHQLALDRLEYLIETEAG